MSVAMWHRHPDHDCRFPFDLVQCLWKWRPHTSIHGNDTSQKKKEWPKEKNAEKGNKVVSKKTSV